MVDKLEAKTFFARMAKWMSSAYLVIGLIFALNIFLMRFVDHSQIWLVYLIVFLALTKSCYFTVFTLRQVKRSIEQCHSFAKLLWVFGMLILMVIVSFAIDFSCLDAVDGNSFQMGTGNKDGGLLQGLFSFFYFSVVTFASVGYGDMVPLTVPAKVLVILEIGHSFILIVFGITNIKNIHIMSNTHSDKDNP